MIYSYLFTLLGLPILIAQWVGVLAFRRGPRGASWVLMLCGVIINSLTPLLPFLSTLLRSSGAGAYSVSDWLMFLPGIVSIFGSMLFFVGFALHGLKAARTADRQAELEQLAAAMSEEIDRLKGSSRT
jgi:uncharacterized membrane protein